MVNINRKLWPIKAHFFLFMAAVGPILPQISVHGKELGISPDVMGYITSILPILYVLAKPGVGLLADHFVNFRKHIFLGIILLMTICYGGFYFVPEPLPHSIQLPADSWNFTGTVSKWQLNTCDHIISKESLCSTIRKLKCYPSSSSPSENTTIDQFEVYIKRTETIQPFPLNNNFTIENYNFCMEDLNSLNELNSETKFICGLNNNIETSSSSDCINGTLTFWLFVILLSLGTICFNITNCISDAICFDVLGENQESQYGAQRVWGTIGFGLTALIAGIAVDFSTIQIRKSFTPAILLMVFFSCIDMYMIRHLTLPKSTTDSSVFHEVTKLLKQSSILIFLCFATLAGIIDSFIIYFMFWHLEQVAEMSGYMGQIKLIEGLVVAAECLCGEIPMFLYSGKIIKKLGYVNCLSLCFFTYSIRLALISIITNPWYLIPIEMIMQGCTYALCYTCIVAYASAIAPIGTSATIQGLVAGMDDGLGYAIGSLIGGQIFQYYGGRKSFQLFAILSFVTCLAHILLRPSVNNKKLNSNVMPPETVQFNLIQNKLTTNPDFHSIIKADIS